jgi:hypothetical protein
MKHKLNNSDIDIYYAFCYLLRNKETITKASISRLTNLTWSTINNRINYHREFEVLL